MLLDSKVDFDEHIKGVFDKTSKSVGLILVGTGNYEFFINY